MVLAKNYIVNFSFILLLISPISGVQSAEVNQPDIPFFITSHASVNKDSTAIILDNTILENRINLEKNLSFSVIDMNNKKTIPAIIFKNNNSIPQQIIFYIKIDKNEPLRPFLLQAVNNGKENLITHKALSKSDSTYKITLLYNLKDYEKLNKLQWDWSEKIALSIMQTYPNPIDLDIFRSNDWSYTNGFFINGLLNLYSKTGKKEYLDYAEKWYAYFINQKGEIDLTKFEISKLELDEILPGRGLIVLYQITGNEKYKIAAYKIFEQIKDQPRTKEGGFWHKNVYSSQMWLDGIYMADVFYLQFASAFQKPEFYEDAAKQYLFIKKHLIEPKTGLYYHGWDESVNTIWANPQTGASPEFWGRGIGWFIMALIDGLDYLPKENMYYDSLLTIYKDLSKSLLNYQDLNTGHWYQVIDKSNLKDNWPETSATTMIAYAYLKGYNTGLLDSIYKNRAMLAFNGLKNDDVFFDRVGKIYLINTVKVGTLNFKYSDGSYKYYISVDRRINDFKGVAALLYLTTELEK